MNVAAENYKVVREHVDSESGAPLNEATFTEIYELIFHNQSLVKSELGVLQQLIQKKLVQEISATPAPQEVRHGRIDERRL